MWQAKGSKLLQTIIVRIHNLRPYFEVWYYVCYFRIMFTTVNMYDVT